VIPDLPAAPPAMPPRPSEPIQIEMPVRPAPKPEAVPVQIAPAPPPEAVVSPKGLSPVQEAIAIAAIIEELRPIFKADGGDVQLVDLEGSVVKVKMSGACAGCQIAALTLGGLMKRIVEALGRPVRVLPVKG